MSRGSTTSIQLDPEGSVDDRLELPGQPYALALWNLIIRPPRRRYDLARLGPKEFRLWNCRVKRVDITLENSRGSHFKCSHFLQVDPAGVQPEPRPVVIYLHQNASCRLEALQMVPLFLPLGISLFTFDFAGCGESEGEYISLGWFERDDLAQCVEYLRKEGKVSAIGLWGRSMGAVTALMHADRDHSIGGMVLDSPFCNLKQLAAELAQSEYLSVKVPSWLLSGALALGRMRIRSLCGFDIDHLAPENHVDTSFIPALFIHARGDDFIAPHHSEKLFQAYTGDKELHMVEGDHNTVRCNETIRKAVIFFCRAFRCSPVPQMRAGDGDLASRVGLQGADILGLDDDAPHRNYRRLFLEASRLLSRSGDKDDRFAWLGERQRASVPLRAEVVLQLLDEAAEAGFCICLCPMPTEWGGYNRPPVVLFACISASGLRLAQATEADPKALTSAAGRVDIAAPILCILELQQNRNPTMRLRLSLGSGGPSLECAINEEFDLEAIVCLMSRKGDATFFDCAFTDVTPSLAGSETQEGGAEPAEEPSPGVTAAAEAGAADQSCHIQ